MRTPLSLSLLAVVASAHAAPHPLSFDDLYKVRRLGGWDVSPDGKSVAASLAVFDVEENRKTSAIWLLDGAGTRQLTSGAKHDDAPRFDRAGKRLAFSSDRDGTAQIYLLDLAGGEARKLTRLPGGVDSFAFSPDGKFLVAASEIFAACERDTDPERCNREHGERLEKSKSSGRVIERLMFRHWDTFRDGRRSHLFRIDADTGAAKDLTPGNFDVPYLDGAGGYEVSPDGSHVAFASSHDPMEAASTNSDVFEVPSSGGPAKNLTADNRAFDGTPRYSPDGSWLAFRSQRKPGHESDRFELRAIERASGKAKTLTPDFDGWVEDYAFTPDGRRILFTSTTRGRSPIYSLDLAGGPPKELVPGVTASEPRPLEGGSIVFSRSSLQRPSELWRATPSQTGAPTVTQLSHWNDALFANVQMGAVREREVAAKDGRKIHAWLVLPPGFDEKKRYPALFLVHGGPEGTWEDGWTFRWNAEMFAAAGYVVYLPDPRGSTGYGQAFVEGILGDWGGLVFDDLLRASADLAQLPFVDGKRVGAAGASFGGFMMNWFQGHAPAGRFKALLCHDGIADQEAMYATEELWFPEAEFGGPPWSTPLYRAASPMTAAADFKTPELIVHGEKDYRVPVEQALLMFTLLQRRGVPSKLLLFPDENHWVLKAANARLWYATFLDWFHRYLGGAAADAKALESARSITR